MKLHRWAEVPEERMNALTTRRMVNTLRMTVAQIRLAKGALIPLHHHENEQVTLVISGRLLFRTEGQEIVVGPGDVLEIPPNLPHAVAALEETLATDLFSPPRQDWISGDDAYLRK